MLTFNTILAHENIDPKKVRLVRHKDNRASGNFTPYNLWLSDKRSLEKYQRIQRRKEFEIGCLLASFVVTPKSDTLFIGLYRVNDIGIAPPGTIDPVLQADRGGLYLYDITREEKLSDYAGHLTVNWGAGYPRAVGGGRLARLLGMLLARSQNPRPVAEVRDKDGAPLHWARLC
jgi:hypothetical protein